MGRQTVKYYERKFLESELVQPKTISTVLKHIIEWQTPSKTRKEKEDAHKRAEVIFKEGLLKMIFEKEWNGKAKHILLPFARMEKGTIDMKKFRDAGGTYDDVVKYMERIRQERSKIRKASSILVGQHEKFGRTYQEWREYLYRLGGHICNLDASAYFALKDLKEDENF